MQNTRKRHPAGGCVNHEAVEKAGLFPTMVFIHPRAASTGNLWKRASHRGRLRIDLFPTGCLNPLFLVGLTRAFVVELLSTKT